MIQYNYFKVTPPDTWGASDFQRAQLRENHTTFIGAVLEVERVARLLPPSCNGWARPVEGAQVELEGAYNNPPHGSFWPVKASLRVESMIFPERKKTVSITAPDGLVYTREEIVPAVWRDDGKKISDEYGIAHVTLDVHELPDTPKED